ncbi:para-aminobenzoate synthase-like protein [Zalerion maritima]|uniref:aminodeoxychorismate synthase n=1 Tax=Zalerion maritima TaxID=339359 RepID=A0AAD5S4H6_9PEZI|nr:para-aminobenzoate synthase-like protein [Zalerion maritima]
MAENTDDGEKMVNGSPDHWIRHQRSQRTTPKILFLDAYDSFTNNIVSLLTILLDAEVRIIEIDDEVLLRDDEAWTVELKKYDAVVCGPGPGDPHFDRDVGLMQRVWKQNEDETVPTLGICLGFQSLVTEFGGRVERLRRGLHGRVWRVDAAEEGRRAGGIFDRIQVDQHGKSGFQATLYHSLGVVEVGNAKGSGDGAKIKNANDLVPLAWARGEEGENILMGVRHDRKPFWGLQYHPESVCTDESAHEVLRSWFGEAKKWNEKQGRLVQQSNPDEHPRARRAIRPSLLGDVERTARLKGERHLVGRSKETMWGGTCMNLDGWGVGCKYKAATFPFPRGASVPEIFELLNGVDRQAILLDSSNNAIEDKSSGNPNLDVVRGRYSILALEVDKALRITCQAGRREAWQIHSVSSNVILEHYGESVWQFLADYQHSRRIPLEKVKHVPFAGGFMGYVTYEMGLHDIGVDDFLNKKGNSRWKEPERGHLRPDLCFAWVDRSLVIDHDTGLVTVQCLVREGEGDEKDTGIDEDEDTDMLWIFEAEEWLDGMRQKLQRHDWGQVLPLSEREGNGDARLPRPLPLVYGELDWKEGFKRDMAKEPVSTGNTPRSTTPMPKTVISTPDPKKYEEKVRKCQEYIAKGDSYELCLTEETKFVRPLPDRRDVGAIKRTERFPWELYKELRRKQPAPFASFMRFGDVTMVSASPERFLEYRPRYMPRKLITNGHSSHTHHEKRPRKQLTEEDENIDWVCTMRPMKGTVRKAPSAAYPKGVYAAEEARNILHTEKEIAENLMIVDLVRHDLHGVCGAGKVTVPRLMGVEEYKSVWQMVTVVEGVLSGEGGLEHYTGLDVLAASLPPGSMTGAPKKRSCEILRELEDRRERSMYSGVVGYMDVAGRGDWSVNIRCLFRWDDDVDGNNEIWRAGAGGAVTGLSTAEGETEEMFTKLAGTLGVMRGMYDEMEEIARDG